MSEATDMTIEELQSTGVTKPLLTIAIPTYNRAPYLKELLLVLFDQLLDEPRVELMISDNATSDETPAVVDEFVKQGLQLRYIRNQTNIGPDANFLQCFEKARGKYVWILGDDDLVLPGAIALVLSSLSQDEYDLVYLSHKGFSGTASDVQPGSSRKRLSVYTNPQDFVRRVHIFMTLISCNIIHKDHVASIEHSPFSNLVGTNLVQLGWTFTALRGHRKSLYVEQPVVSYRIANTGGYGVCRVFGATLTEITEQWLGIPKLKRLILNATLQRFLPYCLLAANQQSHESYLEENAHALLSGVFGNNFRYWFFDYPVIILPSRLAWLWMQMVRVINRIDRAFGLPLQGW